MEEYLSPEVVEIVEKGEVVEGDVVISWSNATITLLYECWRIPLDGKFFSLYTPLIITANMEVKSEDGLIPLFVCKKMSKDINDRKISSFLTVPDLFSINSRGEILPEQIGKKWSLILKEDINSKNYSEMLRIVRLVFTSDNSDDDEDEA